MNNFLKVGVMLGKLELTTGRSFGEKDIYISLTLKNESYILENIRQH